MSMNVEKLKIVSRMKKHSSDQLELKLNKNQLTPEELDITLDILKQRGRDISTWIKDESEKEEEIVLKENKVKVREYKVKSPKDETPIDHNFVKDDLVKFLPNKSSKQFQQGSEIQGNIINFIKGTDGKDYCRVKTIATEGNPSKVCYKQIVSISKV